MWSGTTVSDGVLKVCIRRLRRALGDAATQPRFIETVHRRGYRFIAPLSSAAGVGPPQADSGLPTLVGREQELSRLHDWFGRAQAGARQIVFVTGEAGIGKTTLVEADSVLSSTGRARHICRCWKPWSGYVGGSTGGVRWPSWPNTPQAGWRSCRLCLSRANSKRSSAAFRASLVSGCCARWSKPWKP